jgi:hypothetical protein
LSRPEMADPNKTAALPKLMKPVVRFFHDEALLV